MANLVRNVWTHSVIMCGHFPEGVATFSKTSIEGETRGEWYVRQMLGSANISGSPAMHMMTGNLSFQIEHHLYPDMPSTRYKEIAPRIQDLFERYDLPYVTGSLPKQVASAWHKVFRLALPNNAFGRFNRAPAWVKESPAPAEVADVGVPGRLRPDRAGVTRPHSGAGRRMVVGGPGVTGLVHEFCCGSRGVRCLRRGSSRWSA